MNLVASLMTAKAGGLVLFLLLICGIMFACYRAGARSGQVKATQRALDDLSNTLRTQDEAWKAQQSVPADPDALLREGKA